ncbi:hypothetical protein EDD85DRAFT_826786 [Armillaria nabsnona]|nr:hypothetical protein EDD85DRAFT_826786 [Armillaria nabsnona]
MLRSKGLIKIIYHAMLPLDEAATDEDKYEMELGEGLVHLSAWHLSEHATNPILRLPYNAPSEDANHHDSLFVSAEANPIIPTAVSSSASIGIRSPSSFVRPSNPQLWFLESSSDASVAAPTIQNGIHSPSRTPAVCRRRPALAQVTNTPRIVKATLSRTLMKVRRVERVQNSTPHSASLVATEAGETTNLFPFSGAENALRGRKQVSYPSSTQLSFFLQVPSMERLDRNFSERIEMTRMSSYTPYYVAALGPKERSTMHWSRRALMHAAVTGGGLVR